MKKIFGILIVTITLLPCLAFAHHGHARFGFYIGPGYYYPPTYYYPPPVYYPSPPVVIQSSPPVYVEKPTTQNNPVSPTQAGDWFYCAPSKTYYPYVKECAETWQKVPATPPNTTGQ